MSKHTVIYHVHNFDGDFGDEDGNLGEVEGFMTEEGEILHSWSLNDAKWRNEYFGPALAQMGIEVRTGSEEQHRAFVEHMLEQEGF